MIQQMFDAAFTAVVRGQQQRGQAILIPETGVGSPSEKRLDANSMIPMASNVKRSPPLLILRIHMSSLVGEQIDDCGLSSGGRAVQRRVPIDVPRLEIGLEIQERPHGPFVARLGRMMERRFLEIVPSVDIRPAFGKQADNRVVTPFSGPMKGSCSMIVSRLFASPGVD